MCETRRVLRVKSVKWTPEAVFSVYCNDNLKNLPIAILEDMRTHLDNVIKDRGDKDS